MSVSQVKPVLPGDVIEMALSDPDFGELKRYLGTLGLADSSEMEVRVTEKDLTMAQHGLAECSAQR
jgi:hypothetical protein